MPAHPPARHRPAHSAPALRRPPAVALDLRSPFVVRLRELGRRPGAALPVQRQGALADRLGLELIAVLPGTPIDVELLLQSASEGVMVTGTVRAQTTGECGRCLQPLTRQLEAEVAELFAYPSSLTEQTTDEDEIYRVQVARDGTDALDVEPVVRDAIVLNLPLTPLCRPQCQGLCVECGLPLAELPPAHAHEQLDPRFAELARLQLTQPVPPDHHSSTKE